jgi:hypothetical protein
MIGNKLATLGYNKKETTDCVITYSSAHLSGYRYRWVTGNKVYANAVTPLWSNAPTFGGGVFKEYGYSDTLPEGYENLEALAVAKIFLNYPTRWSYTKLKKSV